MSDSFLPEGGRVPRNDAPFAREDHDLEDESEPDVFFGIPDAGNEGVDEPPVAEHSVFRTPSGQRVDPADDV